MTTAFLSHSCDPAKLPGHWVLASLGKRVLRPGGLELTRRLVERLGVGKADAVVEFAPGLGATARLVLRAEPRSYTGIDREPGVVDHLGSALGAASVRFVNASAEKTGIEEKSASVVYGEAMLSMQTPEQKRRIVSEAHRLLERGGRYGIHELALTPDGIGEDTRKAIEREMSLNIHTGVRPATVAEWRTLLEECGFRIEWQSSEPMHLLEPLRMLRDEGIAGVLRIMTNLLRNGAARKRVLSMRRMFRRHRESLQAIALVAVKV